MDISSVVDILLPIAFTLAGLALAWFLVELARVAKASRKTVEDLNNNLTPTLKNVEQMTSDLQPAVAKIDPLVERVSLTVDAANLELMRVDTILEDVGEITDSLAGASNAIDTVTNAPINIVSNISDRVRDILTSPRSSSASRGLAEEAQFMRQEAQQAAAAEAEAAAAAAPAAGAEAAEAAEAASTAAGEAAKRVEEAAEKQDYITY